MNRRLVLSSVIAGTATAFSAPMVVFGAAERCEDDPLVMIKTPTGKTLPLHVTNYAEGVENQQYLERVPDNQEISNPWLSWSVLQPRGCKKPQAIPAGVSGTDDSLATTRPGGGKRFKTNRRHSLDFAKAPSTTRLAAIEQRDECVSRSGLICATRL